MSTTELTPSQQKALIPACAFIFGFVSGLVSSSKLSARQFLAENAHRLPTTVQGWYFYQKTKNYRVLWGGLKGGARTGLRLGLFTGAYVGLEEGIDLGARKVVSTYASEEYRSRIAGWRTRWASGGIAGVGLALVAGRLYRLSRYGGPKRLFLGLSLGAVAGGSQDLREWLRPRLNPAASLKTSLDDRTKSLVA